MRTDAVEKVPNRFGTFSSNDEIGDDRSSMPSDASGASGELIALPPRIFT